LPERLRNFNIASSDAERMGKWPEKLKSYDDDHAENLRGGGDWHGMSMHRMENIACTRCTEAIYTWNREEKWLLLLLELLWSLCRRIEV
jgi:hypothetical protein